MKTAFIKAISYYLPEKQLTNELLVAEFPEWTAEKVSKKIGISVRHIAAKDETASDMAYVAAQKLFADHLINPETIDFLIFCTQSPDYFLPTSSCILQNRLGIPTQSGAIDFNQGCSGYIYGLAIAKGLVVSGIAKNILLLTAETYSKHLHPEDKVNRTIFGDASSATLVSDNGSLEILEFNLGTDGSGADRLIVKSGGLRSRVQLNDLKFDESGNPISSDHLFMDGTGIFNFTLDMVPVLVDHTLKANNLTKEDIDQFIFHQANKYLMGFLRKKIQIPEDKFYYYLDQVGNTVSSTIPIALFEAQKEQVVKSGDLLLLAGFGVGYSWGGTILKFNK